jgi:hypothetical protein
LTMYPDARFPNPPKAPPWPKVGRPLKIHYPITTLRGIVPVQEIACRRRGIIQWTVGFWLN